MFGIPVLSRSKAVEEYEAGSEFVTRLKLYDADLEAYRDKIDETIVIWARRHGQKVHEFTLRRQFGELWPELERRVLKTLPEKDVWKRFGNGKTFDDWLHDEEEVRRAKLKKKNKSDRLGKLRDERLLVKAALHEAACGRTTKDQVLPFEIPSEPVEIDLKNLKTQQAIKPEEENGKSSRSVEPDQASS